MVSSKRRARSVDKGSVVYAVGDIHGRADLLERLLADIHTDAASRPQPRKVLVCLGDYVDRGPESRRVVDLLIGARERGVEAIFLKGNHEELMLRFLESAAGGPLWMGNGGAATLHSYGVYVSAHPASDPEHLEYFRRQLQDRLPSAHRKFFERLRLYHQEGDYLFVHAGIRPGIALTEQADDDLVWIRREFTSSDADFGKVVVHGHSISRAPVVKDNRIGIDTGAFASGILTCLVLWCENRSFIQTH